MDSNLLQSDQLITPADLPGPNEAHLPDYFLLEASKFDFQPQLQQSLSSLEESTDLQGLQGLQLPSPNYTSLGSFVNEEPQSFEAPSGQISDLSAPVLYVSNNMENNAELNGYAQAEDTVTSLPAAFDPRRTDIMEWRKSSNILSTHTQHSIAESQENLEGISSDEMLRMHSTIWKPHTPSVAELSIPEIWKTGEIKGSARYSEPWGNVQSKTTIPVTEIRKYWPYGPTSDERKALGLPEIQGAAAEYYAVPPIDFNEQITASSTTASTSSVRRGNSSKIRRVARALAAFGNRRSTAQPDQFGDSSSRSLELEIDYPEIGGEELRVGTLPQIAEQHNQYQDADSTATPVPRRHRESRTATFASSGVSGLGVLAGSIGDGPQQRQATIEVPPPVDHELSSTASMFPNPQSFSIDVCQDADLQAPLEPLPTFSVDEIRGVGLRVEKETVLAKMDESIMREAASVSEIKVSDTKGQESSFKPFSREGRLRKVTKIDDFLNDTRLGAWDNEELDLQQFQSVKGPVRDGPNLPRSSSFKRLQRKDGFSNSSISSVHHIRQLSSGNNVADESMAGLDELSNPDQILQSQRRDSDDISELSVEQTLKLGAFALPSLDDSDDIVPRFLYRMAPEPKIPAHSIQDRVEDDDLEITVAYEDLFPEDLDRGGKFEDRPTSQQSTKATNPAAPPTKPAWKGTAYLKEAGPSIPMPRSTRAGPRKSDPAPSAPISTSNPAVPSDDLEIQELFNPNYRFQYSAVAPVASSKAEIASVSSEIDLSSCPSRCDELSSDYHPTIEETLTPEEVRRAGNKGGDRWSPLEEAIRSVEEENYTLPQTQPQPQSPHQKNDTFDSSRYNPMRPVMESDPFYGKGKRKGFPLAMEDRRDSEPVNARNKMGERKADRKRVQENKTQYCGPCVWVLCLPCVVVEVVGVYGREGVKIMKEGGKRAKGWIRGLKKGKKERG
jgi:hypothetical protein